MGKAKWWAGLALLTLLAGCVTINVYFPKAAAEKAAGQFIGSVIDQGQATSATPASAASSAQPQPQQAEPASPPLGMRVLNFVVPRADAAPTANLRIHTPAVDAIHARMRTRYKTHLHDLLNAGVVGFTSNGLVAVRDISGVSLAKRAGINAVVAAENRDRTALYREIANANGHPNWEARIQSTFAALWISKAHKGWYYRTPAGVWKRK